LSVPGAAAGRWTCSSPEPSGESVDVPETRRDHRRRHRVRGEVKPLLRSVSTRRVRAAPH
jgi:hypothetical protein